MILGMINSKAPPNITNQRSKRKPRMINSKGPPNITDHTKMFNKIPGKISDFTGRVCDGVLPKKFWTLRKKDIVTAFCTAIARIKLPKTKTIVMSRYNQVDSTEKSK